MEVQAHSSPPQAAAQRNPLIMDAKELLHLRIEQADEKLLSVLAELTASLFKAFNPKFWNRS